MAKDLHLHSKKIKQFFKNKENSPQVFKTFNENMLHRISIKNMILNTQSLSGNKSRKTLLANPTQLQSQTLVHKGPLRQPSVTLSVNDLKILKRKKKGGEKLLQKEKIAEIKDQILQKEKQINGFRRHLKEKSCFSEELKNNYYQVYTSLKTHQVEGLYQILLNDKQAKQKLIFKELSSKNVIFKSFSDVLKFRNLLLRNRQHLNDFTVWRRDKQALCIN